MIDFHINIEHGICIPQAMLYAKKVGLKACALTLTCGDLPNFFINPDYLSDFAENSSLDFENELLALHKIARVKEARLAFQKKNFMLDNPLLKRLLHIKEQIHKFSIYYDVQAYFSLKLMHIPPSLLENAILQYRLAGVPLVAVYGETITDMVEEGTNFAACNAKADILYCAGLIDDNSAQMAAKNNVYLEISTHQKHSYCNAHIAEKAREHNAKMILGSNAHCLEEIHNTQMQELICQGANIHLSELSNFALHKELQQYS